MAADVTTAGGVAIQASNGGLWAVIGSTVALVCGYVLKSLTDSSTRALAAQAQSHAGEKATLLTLYGNLEQRYGQLEEKFSKLAEDFASLKANYGRLETENRTLRERIGRREQQIKQLADELTMKRQEHVAEKQARVAAESDVQRLHGEVNALCGSQSLPERYGRVATNTLGGASGK